uniref:Uncharacterized protein n=1 Tax=Candidatus Methanogaster sp. ANME-2c ERB4 TaxID=2759911 RepID=A0A7G9YD17_9EURY|nr:hypothetical protein LAAKCKNM_00022 [Methanosarcinales archaeon ANME-2c ERB4]
MVGERLGEEKDFIQRDVYTKYFRYTAKME